MSTTSDDTRAELEARRQARDLGLRLRKSALDGTYMLIDSYSHQLVACGDGQPGYGMTLAEILEQLQDEENSVNS
jgi:hypothetical protein